MTHVVTEPCKGVKCDMECEDVCPVDCFHEGKEMYFIDSDQCIDCEDCVSICPVGAIYAKNKVPEKYKSYIRKNVYNVKSIIKSYQRR